ncbi:hypothetical protein CR513_44908, partial [Mucuna pruriens]
MHQHEGNLLARRGRRVTSRGRGVSRGGPKIGERNARRSYGAGSRELVVDPFDNTHDRHVHLQDFQTQVYISGRTIHTFNDLATGFMFQFATNKAKKLEVANLFDIKQAKGESLKKYLTRFNSATVQRKAVQRLPCFEKTNQHGRIKTQSEKHIKAPLFLNKGGQGPPGKTNPQREGNYKPKADVTQFTPVRVGRSQILREVHTTKNSKTLKSQIEKLIREGHLSRFVQTQRDAEARGHNYSRPNQVKALDEDRMTTSEKKRYVRLVITIQANTTHPHDSVISFSDDDYDDMLSRQDDLMVILVVVVEYKVERVLVDHRSSKLGLLESSLRECSGMLIGFARE